LRINLDPRWYGTFAEIGAGQEVVRWFFRVGGAAGTIAKSISAYDMKVSDAIYGHVERYVSRGRLQAMLDHEFDLDVERLGKERGDNTSFFAFADTVVARSYRGGHEFHGWMGIKFQSRVHDQPSQIVMHLRMLDAEASLQQEALGIVGVNLCYGAFFLSHMPEQLIESLLDKLKQNPGCAGKQILPLMELTMRNLLAGGTDVDRRDFLARAELLAACGMTVLISDYFEYYRLAAYLAWRTKERIGVVMGLPSVSELFDGKYYTELPGGILENFGRLFKNDLKVYVYPLQRQEGDELANIRTRKVNPELQLLYDYLVRRGSFVQLDNFNPKYLSIFSRDVLKRIASGDESWDEMVPSQVAAIIRERGFFGYT